MLQKLIQMLKTAKNSVVEKEIGEYMPRSLRQESVNEIRSSHFTLGYDKPKPATMREVDDVWKAVKRS